MKTYEKIARKMFHGGLPVPGFLRPLVRLFYYLGVGAAETLRVLYAWLIVVPVMRSVASGGRGLRIERIPYVRGRGRIKIGSDVYISGKIDISFSSHAVQVPELCIGDRTFIGHQCSFSSAGKITIGNDCLIANGVRIQDNDGHPLDADRRRAGEPVSPEDVQPVIVEDGVWIAPRATILKGVTVGENSVIGAGSVVTKDVPPNIVAAGNPARKIKSIDAHNGPSDGCRATDC